MIEKARRWAEENPDRYRQTQDEYRASGKKSVSGRKSHLKRTYGITVERYDEMLAQQYGGCAICGRPPREGTSLHVDHEHDTGRIRGLLCFPCNNSLGLLREDPFLLREARTYLDVHGPVVAEEVERARARVRQLAGAR